MNPKLFFVLVGLLVLIFVIGTSAGLIKTADQKGTFTLPDWGDRIQRSLEKPLKASDVRTAFPPECRDLLQRGRYDLPEGKTCTILVEASKANVRTVTLALEQGNNAEVVLAPRGEGRLTARQTLDAAGDETGIDVFKEGGTLEITCTGDADCRLTARP